MCQLSTNRLLDLHSFLSPLYPHCSVHIAYSTDPPSFVLSSTMAQLPDPSESLASFTRSNAVQLEIRRQYRLTKFSQHKERIYFDWQRDPTWLSWTPRQTVYFHLAQSMCNKLTCVYWSYSSHQGISDNHNPPGPCAAAWTEWHRHCDIDRLEYGFYFGKCFEMQKGAVTSIPELLDTHKKMCSLAEEAERITHPSSVPAFAPLQNVLLVRTGDEADLSASIDFSVLAKHALPRERPDIPFMSESAVIRVPLPVAVEYMCDLQRREEDARPEFYTHLKSNTDRSQNPYLTPIDAKPLF
jgi:hypothetical protein